MPDGKPSAGADELAEAVDDEWVLLRGYRDSNVRKNGSSAAKSVRSAMGVFMMSLLLPCGGGLGGELGEADRPGAGYGEDVAVGP